MSRIGFFYEEVNFTLSKTTKMKAWLKAIVHSEGFTLEQLNYIFCTDEYLHSMNLEYLQHDTLTDIITFDYTENKLIEGDIYISIERVADNAQSLAIDFDTELRRVMAHGILHMAGYKDKSEKDKIIMRQKEESCLSLQAS